MKQADRQTDRKRQSQETERRGRAGVGNIPGIEREKERRNKGRMKPTVGKDRRKEF